MAQFDESKVINALHPEKAEVGKKYYCSDNLLKLKKYVEENNIDFVGILKEVEDLKYSPFNSSRYLWQFLYPYEEPPKQRMTNIQLMEWINKGNGMFKYWDDSDTYYAYKSCKEKTLNNEVDKGTLIRSWDSEEWIEPTVDIYERDCKGDKE